jgi:outer membrane lipoprotein SlyB
LLEGAASTYNPAKSGGFSRVVVTPALFGSIEDMMRSAMIVAAALLMLTAACSRQTGSTYSSTEVGRVIDTSRATVLSSRVVEISGEGEQSGYGPLVGGAAGASAGYLVGGNDAGQVIGTVLGGLVGAGLGWAAEQRADSRGGIEYVLRLESGKDITLVQNREGDETPLAAGTPVLIQRGGSYARVIADPVAR